MKAPDPIGDRRTFAALVRRLNFPDVTFGRARLATREAWEAILPRLAPIERRRLLAAAPIQHALLTATPGGRERLAAVEAEYAPLPPMSAEELQTWISDRLCYYGDGEHLPIVLRALARAPECVREYVVHDVAILGTGISSRGWTSRATFIDREGRGRGRLINLSRDVDERLVLHEAAHTWHSSTAPGGQAVTAQGEAAIRQLAATTERWLGGIDAHVFDSELIAESCAVAWLAASEMPPEVDEQETP